MKAGTVKFYSESRGYGFIIQDDTRTEIFVHMSGLIDKIKEGDRVEFDVEPGKKGDNATRVRRLDT